MTASTGPGAVPCVMATGSERVAAPRLTAHRPRACDPAWATRSPIAYEGMSLTTAPSRRRRRPGDGPRRCRSPKRADPMNPMSVVAVPSEISSAATAPSEAAILNPWPEKPTATTTPSMPGM